MAYDRIGGNEVGFPDALYLEVQQKEEISLPGGPRKHYPKNKREA